MELSQPKSIKEKLMQRAVVYAPASINAIYVQKLSSPNSDRIASILVCMGIRLAPNIVAL
jgi:hypothetical protein